MDSLVEPLDPNAAQTPDVEPQEAPAPEQGQLPDEVLKLPVMQALMAGAPPAVSARIKDFSSKPEAETLVKNKDLLAQAGLNFYRSLSGELGVIFNQFHIHGDDLMAADKLGKLLQVAPPIDQVDHAVSKSGHKNPVLARGAVPQGLAPAQSAGAPQFASGVPAGAPVPAPAPSAPPPPSAVQQRLASARLQALQPGSPTSGAAPGAGRMLNQVLKQVV